MLRRAGHTLREVSRLHRADVRDAESGTQLRGLAVRLLHSSPARVASHVEHGREREPGTHREHLAADHLGDLADQVGIPRGRETERLREGGGAAMGEPADRLLVEEHRDTEAGVLDRDLLDLVDEPGRVLGEQSGGCADPGDLTDAVGEEFAVSRRRRTHCP